jgi:hypothetical protein
MTHICSFCNHNFQKKFNLKRHLQENKCLTFPTLSAFEVHKLIQSKANSQSIVGDHNTQTQTNNRVTINIEKIEIINPVSRLDVNYIEPEKMKNLVEQSVKMELDLDHHVMKSKKTSKLNLLLGEYIKDIICNKDQPQNHAVKYVKKKPPTYNSLLEDKDGKIVNVIKNLKDSCELLEAPILETLKVKLNQYIDGDGNKAMAKGIFDELKKGVVKKALSSVLQNDILNDIQMKFKCV